MTSCDIMWRVSSDIYFLLQLFSSTESKVLWPFWNCIASSQHRLLIIPPPPFLFSSFPLIRSFLPFFSIHLCSIPQHVLKNRYAVLSFLLAVGEEAGSQHGHSIPSQVCVTNHTILTSPSFIYSFLSSPTSLPPSLPPSFLAEFPTAECCWVELQCTALIGAPPLTSYWGHTS